MILPPLRWSDWNALRSRSLAINREAIQLLNQDAPVPYDPEEAMAKFYDAEDAWFTESADILGLDQSTFQQAAARSEIHWRENYGQGFEIRYDGTIHPMRTRPPK